MNKLSGLFLVFMIIAGENTLFAYDWPSADGKLHKTFAQKTGDLFEPGVEFETSSGYITAPDAGEVVFAFTQKEGQVQDLPSALESFVCIAHDDNLRSLVSNVIPENHKTSYKRGDFIGKPFNVAVNNISRHQLMVFDQQLNEIVNPLLVFPPLGDSKSPVILDVRAFPEGKGDAISLFSHSSFSVGYWNLYLDAVDPGSIEENGSELPKGIYSIAAYLNGTEVFSVELTSIQEKAGKWFVKDMNQPLNYLLLGDHQWNLGQVFFNQGTNILELVVKDFQGKETGKTFRILASRS